MAGLIGAGAVDPPVKQAQSGRAGLCAHLRGAVASVAEAFQPVRPHRRNAGVTLNFSGQKRSRVRTAHRRELLKTVSP